MYTAGRDFNTKYLNTMKQKILLTGILIFASCVLLFMSSCSNKITKSNIDNSSISHSENFDSFYDKFVSDSLFQLSRIKFPLEGQNIDESEMENWNHEDWNRDNWQLMKTKIYDVDTTQFKVDYKKEDKQFNGKIWIDNSGFDMEFKFELIENKWFLVYFLNQNL